MMGGWAVSSINYQVPPILQFSFLVKILNLCTERKFSILDVNFLSFLFTIYFNGNGSGCSG